jgi:Amino acid transporters
LYRRINEVGKIGIFFSVLVVLVLFATIITGYFSFSHQVFIQNSSFFKEINNWNSAAFWMLMGNYSSKTLYAFLGYYNVCHLGSEIKKPQRNIPKSIVISILVISVFYLLMQWMVSGAIPQSQITNENIPVISILFEKQFGHTVAIVATLLLLVVASSSLFALLLGYTRIIYAAACEGMHFKVFAHLHKQKNFPDYGLLILGGIAIVFCCLFNKVSAVFKFIVVTRIFIQFIPQAVGVILLRFKKRTDELPYKMPLFPLTAIISILGWIFVFITSGTGYFMSGIAVIVVGIIIYWMIIDRKKKYS